jgi:tetratricopeptide (TPR) repeat protein
MNEPTDMPYELESLLRADGDGPAPRLDAASAQRLVAQAIDGAAAPRVAPLRIKRYAWLLAAALVITGSAAAMYSALQARSDAAHAGRPALARKTPAAAASKPPTAPAPPPATVQNAVPAEIAGAAAPPAPAAPAAPQARAQQQAAVEHGAAGVQDLLRRANALRGEGRYRNAERTYLRVVAQSPNGAPAYSARVAAAALRIERLDDPRGALRLYREALRAEPHGALAPEIHEGMAQAFRKLGQPARERDALSALLREQASGPSAERARARLQELDGE